MTLYRIKSMTSHGRSQESKNSEKPKAMGQKNIYTVSSGQQAENKNR